MYSATALKTELNAQGGRISSQREMILNVFQDLPQGKHLSATQLHKLLVQQDHPIGLPTVYRNLKLMSHMGILRELELPHGRKHYELSQPYKNRHHHLICVKCNQTIEFNNNSILKIGKSQAKQAGFRLIDSQLTVQALCPRCYRESG